MFRLRNVATANVVSVLWAASMFAWFFISALYMQLVLGYSALQVGLAYLPANLLMAAFSLGLSATESGLASGLVNTSFMMGGALGLAILASLAAARTDSLLASGAGSAAALTGGYHIAFGCGAVFAALSSLLGAALVRTRQSETALAGEAAPQP
jgi:hypothetical protein